jgi:hypothetical protein
MISRFGRPQFARPLNVIVRMALCLAAGLGPGEWLANAAPQPAAGLPTAFAPVDASRFSAEVAVGWFDLAYAAVRDERLSPPVAARVFGYLGVGLYEALVPGLAGYQSLAGQLNDLAPLSLPADHAYHWPVVANSALATLLMGQLPGASPATLAAIAARDQALGAQWEAALPPGIYRRSVARGQATGQAILRWAAEDGHLAMQACHYVPPAGGGQWMPTPPGFAPPLLPCWGELRPFLLADGSACSPSTPPTYSEDPQSAFYQEAWEVYTTVNQLTPEQLLIARYWADNPGQTGTPPGHSVSILGQVLVQQGSSLAVAGEGYARLGIALADAFIACWWVKYAHNVPRPITYARNVFGEASWTTPVATPPFPEYPSGHSVQSGAAAQVLTDLFGPIAFTDHTHQGLGFAPRHFADFFAFADEAAISRLYGGIHFRAAIEDGLAQGRCIGQRVSALAFRRQP